MGTVLILFSEIFVFFLVHRLFGWEQFGYFDTLYLDFVCLIGKAKVHLQERLQTLEDDHDGNGLQWLPLGCLLSFSFSCSSSQW